MNGMGSEDEDREDEDRMNRMDRMSGARVR
jgi:hypothetical protein